MSIQSDRWINQQVKNFNMIENFPQSREKNQLSFGTSSYSFVARCAEEFKIFHADESSLIDPKNFNNQVCIDHSGDHCIIPPHSFALGYTIEKFNMPDDTLGVCLPKTVYSRCGLLIGTGVLEPGWSGQLVLEFSNTTNSPIKVYANEGVVHILFFKANEQCLQTYPMRNGEYQGQTGITLPRNKG